MTDTAAIDLVRQRMIEDITARNLGPASHKDAGNDNRYGFFRVRGLMV